MSIAIEDLLARLDKVRPSGGAPDRWMSRCPSHDDRSPSLSIHETLDGRILLNCFAGCSVDDVCAALGLTVADLFPPDRNYARPYLRPEERGTNYTHARLSDALETLDHHAGVVWFALAELRQDGEISRATWDELTIAYRTIGNIRALLRPARKPSEGR